MPRCIFCSKEYDFHKGLTLVKNDGTINYICSSKCRKNLLMKRRKIRWVHKEHELAKVSKKK
jgi:large subunit ribosomal protein L24e